MRSVLKIDSIMKFTIFDYWCHLGQARNHLRCLSKSRESLRSTFSGIHQQTPDQSLSLHGTAAAQALPSLSLGNNKLFPSRGLRSITKRTHRLSEKWKRKTSEPISTIELTFHFPRDFTVCTVLRVTWDWIFCEVFFSKSEEWERHGKQINKQTNLRKFRECLADFLHEVTNLSQWSQIIEKTNEFSTVGEFSLTFPTLGYQSVTHYIPESFHYPVILWAIHSFNINIHESKNQLHMILSMIFLINIRKNVN